MKIKDELDNAIVDGLRGILDGVTDERVIALAQRVANASAAIAIRELQQEDTAEDVRNLNAALANLEAIGKMHLARGAQQVVERVLTSAINGAFAAMSKAK